MGVNPIPDNTPPYVRFAYYPSPPFSCSVSRHVALSRLPQQPTRNFPSHTPSSADCIAHPFPIACVPKSWSAAGRYVPASANQKEKKTWTTSILDSLNYLAIIVGVIINQILGAAWYRTWGKPWMTDVGITSWRTSRR